MIDIAKIRQGMEVYSGNDQLFGTVEKLSGKEVIVNGQKYSLSAFSRLENNRLYLSGQSGAAFQQDQNEIKVPVIEEQLNVGKRQVELGEVALHKTVTQEQVNIPVELRREEVHVQEVDVPDRGLQPGEAAFQEGTIRVPVRGEEALVSKQAVVSGEVVVNKGVTTEQQQISDTVRKEKVSVDNNVTQGQAQVTRQVEDYSQNTVEAVQPEVAPVSSAAVDTGATAANFDQSQITEDMEVYSVDNERLGKVKEVTGSFFLVGRGLFSSDIEANYSAVQQVTDDSVILNLTKEQVDQLT